MTNSINFANLQQGSKTQILPVCIQVDFSKYGNAIWFFFLERCILFFRKTMKTILRHGADAISRVQKLNKLVESGSSLHVSSMKTTAPEKTAFCSNLSYNSSQNKSCDFMSIYKMAKASSLLFLPLRRSSMKQRRFSPYKIMPSCLRVTNRTWLRNVFSLQSWQLEA